MRCVPGWTQGMAAGLAREAQLFAEAIVDPDGGKTGIRQFIDKTSPPLPVRRDGVWLDDEHAPRGGSCEAAASCCRSARPSIPA